MAKPSLSPLHHRARGPQAPPHSPVLLPVSLKWGKPAVLSPSVLDNHNKRPIVAPSPSHLPSRYSFSSPFLPGTASAWSGFQFGIHASTRALAWIMPRSCSLTFGLEIRAGPAGVARESWDLEPGHPRGQRSRADRTEGSAGEAGVQKARLGAIMAGGRRSRQELTGLRGGPGPRLQVRGRTPIPVRGPGNEWRALPQNLATRPSNRTEMESRAVTL